MNNYHSSARSLLVRCLLASFVVVAVVGVVGCEEAPPETPEVIRGVLTENVADPGENRMRVFSGVAQSRSRTELSFRVNGKIQQIPVRTGDILEEGDLVAELDPTDFRISLSEARAALAQAEAEARNAESTYQRIRALYEREGVSRGDLDQARAAAESTKASAAASRNRVQQARLQLNYTKLNTPSAGAVSEVTAENGENIQAGAPVLVFQTGGPPEVEIAMPELLIPEIALEQRVAVRFAAFPDEPYAASISEVGIAPENGGSTYPVRVQVDADWEKIRPGMAADVSFSFERSNQAATIVPTGAVGHDRQGHYVYIVESANNPSGFGTTQRRAVKLGEISAEGLEVLEGIKGGERIVVAGVPRIRDQLKVRILEKGEWP